ncbi:MAG TPA: NlpC/P60 family protein [Candidatus Sulfotelmatobacter sp.]|jgi:cell wall-associated NlpC family hydrolase|nr:NlpC/P60 family protein [Candidatus Sulfotelmatobacter sp.]
MQSGFKSLVTATCALALCGGGLSRAQGTNQALPPAAKPAHVPAKPTSLNARDRSSVIAVALHSKKTRDAGRDCSHLVHAIYERAGFPYTYADSDDLYDGVPGFRQVSHPQPADLVVWHGHVGIVIRPSGHKFLSLLSRGPAIDDYQNEYWKSRGQPRFYRYIKRDS